MEEKEARLALIDRARSFLGAGEADGSHRGIIDAYNAIRPLPRGYRMSCTDPWCAAFVSAVGALAGLGDAILPECACGPMIDSYQKRGRFHRRIDGIQPGDLLFYDWDRNGTGDHVGIVETADGLSCTVIEGNMSDAVGRRTVTKNWPYLLGYASPDFGGAEARKKGGEEPGITAVTLPLLSRGARSLTVRAMQGVLIALGFSCGPDGADGDFGANTESALRRFQSGTGLAPDGICGSDSWKKLLGVSP